MLKQFFSTKNILVYTIGVAYFILSVLFLGHSNIIVGLFGVFLIKGIINKDFSIKPITSIINISIYTLTIAILPYIVNINVYTGVFINFLGIFFLLYLLIYSLKETIYIPFLLGYTFFLTNQVTGHSFKLRIIGLLLMAIASVIIQILYTKLFGTNLAIKHLNKSFELLDKLFDAKINNLDMIKERENLEEHNLNWSKDILNDKQNQFYLNKHENTQLNILYSIRALKFKILNFSNDSIMDLNDTKKILNSLILFMNNKYSRAILIEDLSYFNNKYKITTLDSDSLQIKESVNIIFSFVVTLHDMEKGIIKVSRKNKLRDYIELERNLFKDFRRGSSRFTFAFRTALLISISYFFISIFDLHLGKWIIYTIVSISQPYSDITKQKGFDRIRGTILGGIVFTILNLIFTSYLSRIIIILIVIYFVVAFVDYSKRIFAATIMALTIISISEPHMLIMTWDRLFYVSIGVIIVLIGSALILPYKLENEIYDLVDLYYSICNKAINTLLHIYDDKDKIQEIDNLILEASNIERKILVKNSAYDIKILDDYVTDGRIIFESIHKIKNRVFYYDKTLLKNRFERTHHLANMAIDIDNISNIEDVNLGLIVNKYSKFIKNKGELLVYKDMFDMLISKRRLKYLKKKMNEKKSS